MLGSEMVALSRNKRKDRTKIYSIGFYRLMTINMLNKLYPSILYYYNIF